MEDEYSVIPRPANFPNVPPGQDRLLFSDTSILQGKRAQIKTHAQLNLENHLQDLQRVRPPPMAGQIKPGNPNDNKFRDSKPRLMLMGLRRYVPTTSLSLFYFWKSGTY